MNDDELLRRALERMAPPAPDVTASRARLEQLAPTYRRARTVHRVKVGVASALGALGLLAGSAGVMASLDDRGTTPTGIASPTEETAPDVTDDTPGRVPAADDDDLTPDPAVTSTTPDHLEVTGTPDDSGSGEPSGAGTVGGTDPAPAPTPSTTTAPPSSPEPSSDTSGSPSPGVADDTTVGTTAGGTATVRLVDGRLELVSSEPAPGFTVMITEHKADEIELVFLSADVVHELDFKYDDGRVEVKTSTKTPKSDSHD